MAGSKRRMGSDCYARSVSQEEIDLAISQSIGGHAISELMGMVFEEVRFMPRQQIIKAGDPMGDIYLIAQGEVEIYHDVPLDPTAQPALDPSSQVAVAAAAGLSQPIIDGVTVSGDEDEDEEFLSGQPYSLLALGQCPQHASIII